MRIGVDLDGVLYDFVGDFRNWLIMEHDREAHHLPPAESWNFWKDQWGLTLDEFLGICGESVDAGYMFRVGDPHPDSIEYMHRLREDGHSLHIITARNFGSKSIQNTEWWLNEHDVPHDSLSFSKDKTIMALDTMIDDHAENFIQLEQAGIRAYLLDRLWNQYHETDRRVYDWKDFYERVTSESAD